jgi:hypothetical protein
MTVLIAITTPEGSLGRCDARCYDAKQPHCDCVCGGKNHGRGIRVAAQNTIRETAEWLERAQSADPMTREATAKTARDLRSIANQNTLWPEPCTDPDQAAPAD